MKKFVILLLILANGHCLMSQQLGQFNQYMHNPYMLNPAAAGLDGNQMFLGYRKQWMGFGDGPLSFYFSGEYDIGKKPQKSYMPHSLRISNPKIYEKFQPQKRSKFKHTLAGNIINDVNGFVSKTSGDITYAFSFPFSDNTKNLSIGFSTGFINLVFDQSKVTVLEPDNDIAYNDFLNYNASTIFLDMNFGVWLTTEKYFVGYSSMQLLGDNFSMGGNPSNFQMFMHHFLQVGYNYEFNENLVLVPAAIVRYVKDVPISYDVNFTAYYQDKYWGGLSYRYNAAAVVILGMKYKDLKFGYSFDYSTTGIQNYNSGSHEFLLGYIF
ncbi:MAG: PorP/SprF family type IX secretion system membrane protein [Bacteroidota bacterium]|nr:PorP/SprF family type IX secretion system membrane protein [Bacteroidota bacterium]